MLFSWLPKVASSTRKRRARLTLEALEERTLLQGIPLLVTTNADSGPGSLRAAITTANALPGPTPIDFAIGSGPQTIAILSPLPLITSSVLLDGTTQPVYSGTPLITLTQSGSATGVTDGLNLFASGSAVEGLMITGFTSGIGIAVTGNNETVGGTASGVGNVVTTNQSGLVVGGVNNVIADNLVSGNERDGVNIAGNGCVIEGNRIGTTADGTAAQANGGNGVSVAGKDNVLGGSTAPARNIISGNGSNGVNVNAGPMSDNLIEGNYIGTNAAGSAAVPNLLHGVADAPFQSAGGSNGTSIGGTAAGAGNVISGNNGYGINCGFGDVIQGNLIGTDATGAVALGNGSGGIGVFVPGQNTIGGTTAGAGNVISGNGGDGISIVGNTGLFFTGQPGNNLIEGNKVGTNQTGTQAIPNAGQGIKLTSSQNTIGGTAPGAGNLISGNAQSGIVVIGYQGAMGETTLRSTDNVVEGNLIGLGAIGTALPNGVDGIQITGSLSYTTIGGTSAGAGNIISGNSRYGVLEDTFMSDGGIVQGNRIGTNPAGTAAVPNGADGVAIMSEQGGATIGGTAASAGNLISGNASNGVLLSGFAAATIQNNDIGSDMTGNAPLPNGLDGINISNNFTEGFIGNSVLGNLVSGNGRSGISLTNCDSIVIGVVIQGNTIGLSKGGAKLPNSQDGVDLLTGTTFNRNNVIGGATAGAGNTISGNGRYGVFVGGSMTMGNWIQGNFIGTSADGTAAEGNTLDGIAIMDGATLNVIGGTVAGAGNVISGNGRDGIFMDGAGPTNAIEGNLIGTNFAGSAAVGNHANGVALAFTPNTFIGGTTAGAGNVISGNMEGIVLAGLGTTGNVVQDNFIGTDKGGFAALGNSQNGVYLGNGAADNVIGGTANGAANTIANNSNSGVVIGTSLSDTATTGDSVLSNSIFSNSFQGIDLGNDGPTANTPGGPHSGPNHLQNFPTINSVTASGSGTAIAVSLNSTPGHGFRVELFADSDGQGKTFLGAGSISTDGNGNGSTTITVATAFSSLVGQKITATATDTTTGDTSEFSFPAFTVSSP